MGRAVGAGAGRDAHRDAAHVGPAQPATTPPEMYGDFGQEVDIWNYASAAALGPAAPAEALEARSRSSPTWWSTTSGTPARPGDVGGQLDSTVRGSGANGGTGPLQSLLILQNPARQDRGSSSPRPSSTCGPSGPGRRRCRR